MSFATDAARWRALTVRDATANGQFVYSVKSTSIYCRPTCPARLARRANVGFFKTPAEAEAAGFRPCKRCRPSTEHLTDPQEQAVAKACTLIEERMSGDDPKSFKLQDLAKSVGLTPRYFHKIFKDKTGLTPNEYAKSKMHIQQRASPSTSATTSSVAEETLADTPFELFNLDGFDFNNFDFNIDPGLPFNETIAIDNADQLLPTTAMLDINVNISTAPVACGYRSDFLESNIKFEEQHQLSRPLGISTMYQAEPELWGTMKKKTASLDDLDTVLTMVDNTPLSSALPYLYLDLAPFLI
ncbi:hypothetical protein EJ04DRAFT_516165 [Polyplosphaeria fusca]|uniref:HTH araC/xylS-type domain-containing protein n=1 Tax=Polyplosphaeria fusca TaxID=682080 RepID=A0A9P4UWB2_9PLEO|nr:hypothetical protein EJ04DRAFT_516165 [Polyplosphaeria fusca]